MTKNPDAGQEHVFSRRALLRRATRGAVGLSTIRYLRAITADTRSFAQVVPSRTETHRALVDAARREGHLDVIALPPDWANYGRLISAFEKLYKINITSMAPTDSSAQELQAIRGLRGEARAPDAVDVSPTFAATGKRQGLFAPYLVATWPSIPADMKDPHGYWTGDYWGAISFGANRSVIKEVPVDWHDLTSRRLRGKVAIDGDPRSSGEAFACVMAASLANGGSLDDVERGIDFFARLKTIGNFIPAVAYTASIARGATPLAIKWDYLNLAVRDELKGNPTYTVVIPRSGVFGSFYCQAISRYAPHPNAARLWLEYLYSDEGQLGFLEGYTHPVRYADLTRRGKVSHALARRLPPAQAYHNIRFATIKQTTAAFNVVQEQWGPKVGT